jgi:succinate dehydrogenase / fumarate reductase flavoprotein subunit
MNKLYPTRSHTGAAQGGMCAALANVEEDNWEWHTFDTVKGGDYLVDQDAAEIMCKEAIDAVIDLEKMGLPFNRTPEGRIDQRRFGGHTRNHGEAAGAPGLLRRRPHRPHDPADAVPELHQAGRRVLQRVLRARPRDDRGRRAWPASWPTSWPPARSTSSTPRRSSSPPAASARSVKTTSNAHTLTGDGMGIIWRKGLPLEDMEFYQFHPTGLAGLGILLTEAVRGEGGILRNGDGERFMERYAPTIKDLAPRDMVARAMVLECARAAAPVRTRTTSTSTSRHLARGADRAKLPDITEFARTYLGVDPITELVPVFPDGALRHGRHPDNVETEVLRDNDTRRARPVRRRRVRLRVSVHGANRLGTNSLLDINVFGRRRASRPRSTPGTPHTPLPENPPRPFVEGLGVRAAGLEPAMSGGRDPRPCRRRWTTTLQVYRTEATLKQALSDVQALQERFRNVAIHDKGERYNTELLEAIELGFLLDLAEVVGGGAGAQGVPEVGTPARTTPTATTSTSCATRWRTGTC